MSKIIIKKWKNFFLIIFCFLLLVIANELRNPIDLSPYKKSYPSDAVLLSEDGEILASKRLNFVGRRPYFTPLSEIAPSLINFVIKMEDQHFYRHFGIDIMAIISSIKSGLFEGRKRGASTITMQLAKTLYGKRAYGMMAFWEKIKQMVYAIRLERGNSKNEILEMYLNLVYFKGELQGIAAASHVLFGHPPLSLTEKESFLLSLLIKSPGGSFQKIRGRALWYLRAGFLNETTEEELLDTLDDVFSEKKLPQFFKQIAPHLAWKYLHLSIEGKLKTTLRGSLQQRVVDIVEHHISRLKEKENLHDIAVLVVENKTGKVLSYVGGSGFLHSQTPYVDNVKGLRQAGSIFKPFIYGLAFEKGLLNPSSLLKDAPYQWQTKGEGRTYAPHNYGHVYHGIVTAREALGSSLNVPAIKVLEMLGGGELLELFRKMNIDIPQQEEYYGPSLALGTLDVTLWQMVSAFRLLANGGIWSPLFFLPEEQKKVQKKTKRLMKKESVFLVSSILSDPLARELTFGIHSLLKRPYFTAVKTGTSKDMRDNWCVGYSEKYTVGVWAGNTDGRPLYQANGLTGAGPIWASVMDVLHEKEASKFPKQPEGIVKAKIYLKDLKKSYDEYFFKERIPKELIFEGQKLSTHVIGKPQIFYPKDKMVFAKDPDIPIGKEKIIVKVHYPQTEMGVFLDGEKITEDKVFLSLPHLKVGKHLLALKNKEAKILDEVTFYVK